MEIITCNDEMKKSIIKTSPIIIDNKRIKAGRREEVSIMEYLENHKDKITEDYYVLANKIYKDENGVSFAFEMDELSEFNTIDEMKAKINKYMVGEFVYKVLNELMSINVLYWDIHVKNVLIFGELLKLIDLDDAVIGKSKIGLLFQKQNYIEFLLNIYLSDILPKVSMNRFIVVNESILNVFSRDVKDYIKGVLNKEEEYLNFFSLELLEELNKEETIENIKYELKRI